jgi:hypothetical protein
MLLELGVKKENGQYRKKLFPISERTADESENDEGYSFPIGHARRYFPHFDWSYWNIVELELKFWDRQPDHVRAAVLGLLPVIRDPGFYYDGKVRAFSSFDVKGVNIRNLSGRQPEEVLGYGSLFWGLLSLEPIDPIPIVLITMREDDGSVTAYFLRHT